MQQTDWIDRDGEIRRTLEIFNLPTERDQHASALRARYERAVKQVFGEGGELLSIRQGKVGSNDPCPCGSGRKFKRCCETRLRVAIQTAGH